MANWIYNAKQDLIEYESLCQAMHNIPEQIEELENQIMSLKSVQYDKTPVQGGISGQESRLIDYVDRKARLKINYEIAKAKQERITRGLDALSDKERRVVELLTMHKGVGNLSRLCMEMGYEKSQVYNIQSVALKKFTLAMFGVVDL